MVLSIEYVYIVLIGRLGNLSVGWGVGEIKEDYINAFKSTPHGMIKRLHEIVGMVHAGIIMTYDDDFKELLTCIEGQIDSLISGLEEMK